MSKRLQDQASKLWHTVSDAQTTSTYQQTIAVTWSILKETGKLVWLTICFGLVAGEWFWKWSYNAGGQARVWITKLSSQMEATESQDSGEFWSETGKSLLEASKKTAFSALSAAKDQLGLEAPPPASPSPPEPTAAPSAVTPPSADKPPAQSDS